MTWRLELREEFPAQLAGHDDHLHMRMRLTKDGEYFQYVVATWSVSEAEAVGATTATGPEFSTFVASAAEIVKRWVMQGLPDRPDNASKAMFFESPRLVPTVTHGLINQVGALIEEWSGVSLSSARDALLLAGSVASDNFDDVARAMQRAAENIGLVASERKRVLLSMYDDGLLDADVDRSGGNVHAFHIRGLSGAGASAGQSVLASSLRAAELLATEDGDEMSNVDCRVFVSHAGNEQGFSDPVVDQLLKLGLGLRDDEIFYSSRPETSAPAGESWFEAIRDRLRGVELVLVLVTDSFWQSPMSLLETGAGLVNGQPFILRRTNAVDRGVLGAVQMFDADKAESVRALMDQMATKLDISLNVTSAARAVDSFISSVGQAN